MPIDPPIRAPIVLQLVVLVGVEDVLDLAPKDLQRA